MWTPVKLAMFVSSLDITTSLDCSECLYERWKLQSLDWTITLTTDTRYSQNQQIKNKWAIYSVGPAHWSLQQNLAMMRSSVYELESRRAMSIESTHSDTLNLHWNACALLTHFWYLWPWLRTQRKWSMCRHNWGSRLVRIHQRQESFHKNSEHTATTILKNALPRTKYFPAACVSYRLLGENAVWKEPDDWAKKLVWINFMNGNQNV